MQLIVQSSVMKDLEDVSMTVRETLSGKKSAGKLVGGSTGGTASGNDSDAMAAIRLDFPVPRSPATTTRTPLRPVALFVIDAMRDS